MEILKVGMPAIPMNFSETISISVDRYFIQKWLNLSHLGIYSHSMSYKQSFSMGTKAFTKIYFPEVVQIVSNKGDPEKLKRIMTVWYGLLGIAGLFVTLFSYEIIDIITHGKFVKAAPLVPLWFLLTFSYSFGRTYSSYLAVLKKTMFMMYTSIGVGAIFTAIAAFLIYQFGIMGAVVAAILSNFTLQLTRRIYSVRLGCAPVAEKEFMLAAGIILSVFFINSAIPFNFAFKSFCFIVCSILIAYRFNLIQLVKTHFMDNLQWLKSAS